MINKSEARKEGLDVVEKLRYIGFDVSLCHDDERKTYYLMFHRIIGNRTSFPYDDEERHDA